jgi:hypothetical protein
LTAYWRMNLRLCAPRPSSPRNEWQETLTCGQQVCQHQQRQKPLLASKGALTQAGHSHLRKTGATPCPLSSPLAEPTDMSRTPLQARAARWLGSGRYQMCTLGLIPGRLGKARKGPLACSQALIGSWILEFTFLGSQEDRYPTANLAGTAAVGSQEEDLRLNSRPRVVL